MAISKNALIQELKDQGITVRQAALMTGWYPEVKGDPFTFADPIEAIERFCELNNLSPRNAVLQLMEMKNS